MHFSINLTNEDLQVIGAALAQLPYKDVATLLNKLQTQIDAQQQGPTDADSSTPESASEV